MVRGRCRGRLTLWGSVPSLRDWQHRAAVLPAQGSAWWEGRAASSSRGWPRWCVRALGVLLPSCSWRSWEALREGSTLCQGEPSLLLPAPAVSSPASQTFFLRFHVKKRGNQREVKIISLLGSRYRLKFCCSGLKNRLVQCLDITVVCS